GEENGGAGVRIPGPTEPAGTGQRPPDRSGGRVCSQVSSGSALGRVALAAVGRLPAARAALDLAVGLGRGRRRSAGVARIVVAGPRTLARHRVEGALRGRAGVAARPGLADAVRLPAALQLDAVAPRIARAALLLAIAAA